MLLGQRLTQAGLLTLEHVQMVVQSQVVHGGRFGSSVLRLGFLDIDGLANVLAAHRGAPAAKLRHFENAERAALTMIPAAVALKYQAVPLAVSPVTKELIVAFRDPTDLAAIDDITFVTGAKIHPFVAPETCIQRYLERYYGDRSGAIPMGMPPARPPSNRSSLFGLREAQPTGDLHVRTGDIHPVNGPPPPRLAEAPVGQEVPLAAAHEFVVPDSAPWITAMPPIATGQPWSPSPDPSEVVFRRDSNPLLANRPAADAAPPTPPALVAPLPPFAALSPPRPSVIVDLPAEDAVEALTLDEAVARIEAAKTKEDIADAIVQYLRGGYGCGLILLVKDGIGLGWAGFAPRVDADTVASITVPLSATPMFQQPCETKTLFRGAPSEENSGVQARFYKLLHREPPREVITVPITLKQRVVNLIYAHPPDGSDLPATANEDLTRLSAAAAEGFLRLIKIAKNSLPPVEPS